MFIANKPKVPQFEGHIDELDSHQGHIRTLSKLRAAPVRLEHSVMVRDPLRIRMVPCAWDLEATI